jgi:hypothetical protein
LGCRRSRAECMYFAQGDGSVGGMGIPQAKT